MPLGRHSVTALATLAAVGLLAGGVCWPLFGAPWFDSHEGAAYPIRTVEYAAVWRAGVLVPRWAPDLYGGYGAPMFNFYAPGVFALAALGVLAGLSAALALKLTVLLATLAGGVGTWALARAVCGRADAALLAAVAFLLVPYRLTQLYSRGDLAEYAAIALVPAALLAYRQIAVGRPGRPARAVAAAAFAHAAVLLTHTLTGQWFTELAAGYALFLGVPLWRQGQRWRCLGLALALAASGGLTAFYALPALLERDEVAIARMTVGAFAVAANAVPAQKLLTPGFFWLGLGLLAALGHTPLVALRTRRTASGRAALRWWLATLVPVLLTLPLAAGVWPYLPFARFLQFPWRLLGFAAVLGAVTLAWWWTLLVPVPSRLGHGLLALLVLALIAEAAQVAPKARPMAAGAVPQSAAAIASGMHSTVSVDEYLPLTVPARPARPRAEWATAVDAGATVQSAQAAGTGCDVAVAVAAPGAVDIHVHAFPGWLATDAGGRPLATAPSPLGLLRVALPSPGRQTLHIRFGATPLRRWASAISALTLLVLTLLAALEALARRRQRGAY